MRILTIEDDQKLNALIRDLLEKEGYVCVPALDLATASEKLQSEKFDAILLDVMLPDGDGIEFCARVRGDGIDSPILMLTGKQSKKDTIHGLDAGADDYMVKPFSPNELNARLRALLRRPQPTLTSKLVCGDIVMNSTAHTVTRAGKRIELMPKEYSLLEHLLRKKNEVVKKEDLLRHVWGIYSKTSSNRLEVYIRYLREKIDLPFNGESIQTVRGLGYRIIED